MANLETLIDELSKLTILEASDLVKKLEEKWGVKASSGANTVVAQQPSGGDKKEPEKTEFDVELTEVGPNKIQVIKTVRELTGLGLKEAKAVVDGAPKVIKASTTKPDADLIKSKLEEQGAKATIK